MTKAADFAKFVEANTWGQAVEKDINSRIEKLMKEDPKLTRQQAAAKILDSKEGWYVQTPEGEYLCHVAGRKCESTQEDTMGNELEMGKQVEQEHSSTIADLVKEFKPDASDEEIQKFVDQYAERIAQDHLKELPDYYTRLKAMEKS